MKLILLIACGSMLHLGTSSVNHPAPETDETVTSAARSSQEPTASAVPEPNTMFFAGIGGFALLIFAIRRK